MKKSRITSFVFFGLAATIIAGGTTAETSPKTPEPLVLRKIMQDMGNEMATIAGAISREDWQEVEKSAMRIADHPKPPMEERSMIIGFLGKDMARFKGHDTKTHDIARRLAEQAAHKDAPAVISTFAALQRSCLGCHRSFRKPIQEHFYGTR